MKLSLDFQHAPKYANCQVIRGKLNNEKRPRKQIHSKLPHRTIVTEQVNLKKEGY